MASIGDILGEERRKRGKSLKEVEEAIKIRAVYLDAIEKDDFHVLPASAYAKAFIRSYADYLEIDPTPLIEEYRRVYERTPKIQRVTTERFDWHHFFTFYRQTILRVAFVGILLLLMSIFVFLGISRDKPKRSIIKPTEVKEVKPTQGESTQGATPGAISQPTTSVPQEELVIKATVTDEVGCWIKVTVDGALATERVLKKGEFREWRAKQSITIRVGKPKGIVIEKNGVVVPPMPVAAGGVAEQTFVNE